MISKKSCNTSCWPCNRDFSLLAFILVMRAALFECYWIRATVFDQTEVEHQATPCWKQRRTTSSKSSQVFGGLNFSRFAGLSLCQSKAVYLISVRKIQVVRGLNGHARVTGIKVKSRLAGLDIKAEALERFFN